MRPGRTAETAQQAEHDSYSNRLEPSNQPRSAGAHWRRSSPTSCESVNCVAVATTPSDRRKLGFRRSCLGRALEGTPALPLWESTAACGAVRGKPRSGVENKLPLTLPAVRLASFAARSRRKPSPTRREGPGAQLSSRNPRAPKRGYTQPTSSSKGRIMRRREAGRGAVSPRVRFRRPNTRGGAGLPPGPLRGPARSWLTTRRPIPNAVWPVRRGPGRAAGQGAAKAGPAYRIVTAKEHVRCLSACGAPTRRPRDLRDRELQDLRLSARHPLNSRGNGGEKFCAALFRLSCPRSRESATPAVASQARAVLYWIARSSAGDDEGGDGHANG